MKAIKGTEENIQNIYNSINEVNALLKESFEKMDQKKVEYSKKLGVTELIIKKMCLSTQC